ncbi:MAG: efflux RND transporter periplasmic adaptor subunit [Verrucomicrobiota bacterium]|nr:efflux RND transporter periplasmic adaptor subunit [Verrucomicrobiota bacterium]
MTDRTGAEWGWGASNLRNTAMVLVLFSLLLAGCGRSGEQGAGPGGPSEAGPIPVEGVSIVRGPIEDIRVFSGTLEAPTRFVVAPKTSGRVVRLHVDVSDVVHRGQVIAELDDDEYQQAVAQARADVQVAEANRAEAESALEIAIRKLERSQTLQERGVASEANLDSARAEHLAAKAALQVAEARVIRDQAALAAAEIRLGYTSITADWNEGDDERVVGERFVEEGDTVSANSPLISIIELDPVRAVVFVTERDYGRLVIGQEAELTTDAWPRQAFPGKIARVAPVFTETTRQARVEVMVDNPEHRLKPGMFALVSIVLDRAEDAVLVPESALTKRAEETGVFVIAAGDTVVWRPVEVGIRHQGMVQISGEGLTGSVVTLGQQFLDDGSAVILGGKVSAQGDVS